MPPRSCPCRIAAGCLLLLLFALMPPVYGQNRLFRSLEDSVYKFNNAQKYTESQALLLPVLQSDGFTADEKYQAALLLSYTYKRVQDYHSTLQFLAKARTFARKTPKKDQYSAIVLAQEAFVYFDTHQYRQADSLMRVLEQTDFRYIDLENKAKLIHQQGYLLFLAKQYPQADAIYDRAIAGLRVTSPCDLPMIYVKKMQLYAAMNRMDLVQYALKQSNRYADSCDIIKYRIYAYEELLVIYRNRNDVAQIAAISQVVDSLNIAYTRSEHIAALHDQKESLLLGEKDQKLQQQQTDKTYLTAGLAGLGLLAAGLLAWLIVYRRRQRKLEVEYKRMRAELETYLARSQTLLPPAKAVSNKATVGLLSDRQQEILRYLSGGLTNKEIADRLSISENTVKYHIKNVYQLLDIKDRRDLFLNGEK